jgi:hypothetical protein
MKRIPRVAGLITAAAAVGPHLLMLTDPGAVTSLIEQAAAATTGR